MGCWGITAFESDAGLDSVDYIRCILPQDGKLELGKIIEALKEDDVRLPDVQDAESHTSPMALAEIMVNFIDGNAGGMDYDGAWAAEDNKFGSISSFTASIESVQWLRNYLSDTLKYARENEKFQAEHGTKWNGWFEEKDWIGWQEHMISLVSRLDTLIQLSASQTIDLLSPQIQESITDISAMKMN